MNYWKKNIAIVLVLGLLLGMSLPIGAAEGDLTFTTKVRLEDGVTGEPYSYQIEAGGGTAPYRFALVGGALPKGVTLSTDGTLSGMPESCGFFPTVRIRVTDAAGAYVTQKFQMNIRAIELEFEVSGTSYPYDGKPHGVTVTAKIDGEVTTEDIYTVLYAGSETEPTDVGSYPITIRAKAGYYAVSQSQSTLYIRSDSSSSVTLSNLALLYNGNPQGPTVTAEPEGLSHVLTYFGAGNVALEGLPTEPGSYKVSYITTNKNYTIRQGSASFSILKIPVSVTMEDQTAEYDDGNDILFSAGAVTAAIPQEAEALGLPEYRMVFDDLATAEQEQLSAVKTAGRYKVYAQLAEEDEAHYSVQSTAIGSFTVAKKQVTFAVSDNVKAEIGSAQEATVTPSNAPNLLAEHVTVTYYQKGTPVVPIAIGTYDIHVTVDDSNYSFDGFLDETLTLHEATKVPIIITGWSTEYTAQPQKVTAAAGEDSGYEGTIKIQYRVDGTLVDEVSDAGSYPIVITLEPGWAAGALDHENFVIAPQGISFSLGSTQSEYNGAAVTPALVTNPEPPAGKLQYDVSIQKAGAPVGSILGAGEYTLTISNLDANHTIQGNAELLYTVTKKPVQFVVSDESRTVTGEGLQPSISVAEGSLAAPGEVTMAQCTVTYYDGASPVQGLPSEVGEYRIHVKLSSDNYVFEDFLTETFTIREKEQILFAVTDWTKEYTGAQLTATVSPPSGFEGGYLVQYRDAGQTLHTSVAEAGTYEIVVTLENGEQAANLDRQTFVIAPQAVRFSLSRTQSEYNGAAVVPVVVTDPQIPAGNLQYDVSIQTAGAPVDSILDAGEYTFIISNLDANHTIQGDAELLYTVEQMPVQFSLEKSKAYYTGQEITPVVLSAPEALLGNFTVRYQKDGVTVDSIVEEGIYTVLITAQPGNYKVAESQETLEFTVAQKSGSIELAYGNTPFGRFAGEPEREALEQAFLADRTFAGGQYSILAWDGGDLDADAEAVVVHGIASFSDPGFAAFDDEGNPAEQSEVTVTIEGRYLTAFSGLLLELGPTPLQEQTLSQLAEQKPVLGLFTITYTLGVTVETRTFVLLPKNGDANLDGTVNANDATFLAAERAPENLDEALQKLYWYRVCDANQDGLIDAEDAKAVQNRFNTPITPFYQ